MTDPEEIRSATVAARAATDEREAGAAQASPRKGPAFTLGGRLSFEALLIVLSVLIGFGVSEWRQASADRQLADRVVSNLRTEIEHNLRQIDEVAPQHRRILELVASADVADSQLSGWEIIFSALQQAGGGLSPPRLRQGAWDAAVSTGALRLLDYELVAALSEIYVAQSAAAGVFARLMTAYEPSVFQPGLQRETVQAFRWTTVEIVSVEEDLRQLYEQQLPLLDIAVQN